MFGCLLLCCWLVLRFRLVVRYQQFETWELTPKSYFVGERPMMTTLDAPYWLRLAREYNEGVFRPERAICVGIRNLRRLLGNCQLKELSLPLKYTDTTPVSSSSYLSSSSQTQEINYRDVPLLSFIIAHLAPFFNYNYYLTGTMLIPILASLFILPLGMYFFRIGVPVSGLLGGLIGTFAAGYYMRSSIGRIDTDMLNLFFPVLAGLMILLAGKAKTERNILLCSIGAGLSLFLFQWWYRQSWFYLLAYFLVLVFSLFVQQIRFQDYFGGCFFVCVVCTQPVTFMSGTGAIQRIYKRLFSRLKMHGKW